MSTSKLKLWVCPVVSRYLIGLFQHRNFSSSLAVPYSKAGTPPPSSPPRSQGEQAIYDKLQAKFSPTKLQVQDISGGCGTFYAIGITSSTFKGLPIIQQHRLVNSTLKEEIRGIHGLQLKTTAE